MEVLETVGQGVKGVDMIYTCQSPEFCFRANQPCRSEMQPIMLSSPLRGPHAVPKPANPQEQPIQTTSKPSRGHSTRNGAFQLQYPNSLPITMRFRRAGALSTLAATPPFPPTPDLTTLAHNRPSQTPPTPHPATHQDEHPPARCLSSKRRNSTGEG